MRAKRTSYSVLRTQYLVLGALAAIHSASTPAFAAPPKLNNLFPAGGQRGQSVIVTAAGEFSTWPVQVWADRVGVSATAEKDKGKFKLDVAVDAIPGVYWLRLHNGEGASVFKPFVVGTLPEVAESEPN